MTRRSLRNRRERFPETYTRPAAPAPVASGLPPGYKVIEVTPAMREQMRERAVELAGAMLSGASPMPRLLVIRYSGRPVFALLETTPDETLAVIGRFMHAACASGARTEDFDLVLRKIAAAAEGDKVVPATTERSEER